MRSKYLLHTDILCSESSQSFGFARNILKCICIMYRLFSQDQTIYIIFHRALTDQSRCVRDLTQPVSRKVQSDIVESYGSGSFEDILQLINNDTSKLYSVLTSKIVKNTKAYGTSNLRIVTLIEIAFMLLVVLRAFHGNCIYKHTLACFVRYLIIKVESEGKTVFIRVTQRLHPLTVSLHYMESFTQKNI